MKRFKNVILILIQNYSKFLTKNTLMSLLLLDNRTYTVCLQNLKLILKHFKLKIYIVYVPLTLQDNLVTTFSCSLSLESLEFNDRQNSDNIQQDNDEFHISNQLQRHGYKESKDHLCVYEIYNTEVILNIINNNCISITLNSDSPSIPMIDNIIFKILDVNDQGNLSINPSDNLSINPLDVNDQGNLSINPPDKLSINPLNVNAQSEDNNSFPKQNMSITWGKFDCNTHIVVNFFNYTTADYRKRIFHFYKIKDMKKKSSESSSEDLGDYDLSKYNSDDSLSHSDEEDISYSSWDETDSPSPLLHHTAPDILHVSKRIKV